MLEILRYIRQRCRRKFDSFLLHESMPPPTVFFLVFLYAHSEIESPTSNFAYILFGFGVAIALLCNFNFLFTMAPFINCTNLPVSFIMFFICILACNQKWKSYLFFLAIGDSINSGPLSNAIFLSVMGIYLCSQAYQKLIFKTVDDNLQFFAGFFAVAIHYTVKIVRMNNQINSQIWFDLPLMTVSLVLGYSIMFYKIKQLKNTQVSQIRDSRVMAHYLKLLQEDIKDELIRNTKIILHGRKCIKLNCFCQSKDTNNKPEYFLRQIYENSINYFSDFTDPLLWEYYMGILLKNEQIINALHNLTFTKPTNYFTFISWSKQQALIKSLLQQFSSPIVYEKQYIYSLEYDQHCLHLALEIHEILQMKLNFWSEVGREAPLMQKLQKQGVSLVEKMYKLNKFYNSSIKIYEKNLYSFDATVLYGMYLLSTTNFKQYAEIIIKNTSKLLEEVYVFDNSASQTFAIRTVAENQKKSYLSFKQDSLNLMRNPNVSQTRLENTEDNRYKLIIDAVSSGFCRLIKINKAELIGQELNSIIPDGYKQVHNIRLSYLLDFESESLKDIVPSKVMHKELKLPIKGADNELFMGFVCIKFQIDIEKGLTFISIIKRVHDKTTNVLMNFKNEVTEKEEGFFEKILEHTEVKKYIEQLKENWRSDKVIREEKFNLMINTANYGVSISSPLLGLFLQKQNLKDKAPPIHIQIVNEETNRNRTLQNDKNNKMARQIKKMQTAIVNYDTESSTSNTKGSSSAINVLTTFSESNSVPEYRCIQIVFLLIIMCCIGSNVIVYASTNLSWDSNSLNNNPVNDTINMYTIEMLTSKTLLNVADLIAYFQDIRVINRTQISSYYGNSQFQASIIKILSIFQKQFRNSIYHCLNRTSKLLGPKIQERFSTYLSVLNMVNYQIVPTMPFQNMTFLELMMNYLVDFQAMAIMDLSSPIMFYSYLPNIVEAQNATELTTMIDDSIAKTEKIGLIIEVVSAALVCFLLIPLGIVLKRRLHIHEKVFDLIVSVESSLVVNEIKSLAYICNILKNYQQSNQILKTNVLQYKQNVIMPKRNNGGKRASADNQIIQGLQKYDTHILVEPETDRAGLEGKRSKRSSSISNSSKVQSNSSSIFTAIKSQFTSVSKESPNRKRAGQLDLTNSDSDPDKTFISKHVILYVIIVLFIIFRIFSSLNNQALTSDIKLRKDELINLFTDQIKFDMKFLGAKVYLRAGEDGLRSIFGVTQIMEFIYPLVSLFPVYDYNLNNGYEQILSSCVNKNIKLCQYNYSYSVLKGQFGTLFKSLIQLRFQTDQSYKITKDDKKYKETILTISQRLFFLQSINNRLEQMLESIMSIHYQEMTEYSLENGLRKQQILITSIIWGILCIIVGFSIIWKLKEQYFRQVYTITFLNSEMVLKNKRVESFLDSLSKSIYL